MPAPKKNTNAVKDDGVKASTQLQMRVTPSEKAQWVKEAQRVDGRSLADLVRVAMAEKLAREKRRRDRT